MGEALSKVSCVRPNHGRPRKKKRKGRKSSDPGTSDEQASVYEAIRRDMVNMDRIRPPSNASDVTRLTIREGVAKMPERSISQVVLLPTKDLNALQRRESFRCVEENPDTRKVGDGKCEEENKVELAPDTSKKICNSIELVHCPDMSSITMQTEPSCTVDSRRISEVGNRHNILATPSYAFNGTDDLTTVTEMDEEESKNSLQVPPNSVNSQFISGITPLESPPDADFLSSANNDSVFANNSPNPRKYFLDGVYYTACPADNVFLNNNSITTSLEYGTHQKNKKQVTG